MKKLLAILCLLVTFVACSDDDDNTPTSPIDGLKLPPLETTFTTGQAVTIEGKGFNRNSQIWLRAATKAEGDIQAEITEVNENSITFTVPENVDGQKDIILKQDGKEYTLGKLTFKTVKLKEQNLYAYRTYKEQDHYLKQILKIDISTGEEKLLATIDIDDAYLRSPVFYTATQEIIGIDYNKLFKLNVNTKETKVIPLERENEDIEYNNIVLDNQGNLYGYRTNNDANEIVKIDMSTGKGKLIASIADSPYMDTPVYIASTNEIILINEKRNSTLVKVNIETQKITTINIAYEEGIDYSGLVVDDNNNLYSFKRFYKDIDKYQIIKFDINTGVQTVIAPSLDVPSSYFESMVYISKTKEIIGIEHNERLLKVNIETGQYIPVTLGDKNCFYDSLITD